MAFLTASPMTDFVRAWWVGWRHSHTVSPTTALIPSHGKAECLAQATEKAPSGLLG